jgi:predicted nucleic acid-binding protein
VQRVPKVISQDPDDDVILACAIAGRADDVVSRDHHLLDQTEHEGVPITSPEEFMAILRSQPAIADEASGR